MYKWFLLDLNWRRVFTRVHVYLCIAAVVEDALKNCSALRKNKQKDSSRFHRALFLKLW